MSVAAGSVVVLGFNFSYFSDNVMAALGTCVLYGGGAVRLTHLVGQTKVILTRQHETDRSAGRGAASTPKNAQAIKSQGVADFEVNA